MYLNVILHQHQSLNIKCWIWSMFETTLNTQHSAVWLTDNIYSDWVAPLLDSLHLWWSINIYYATLTLLQIVQYIYLTTEVPQPAVEIIKILADYRLPSALFALCYHIYYLVFIIISHNILGGMIKLKIVFHSVNLLCITSSPASTYLTLASLM